MEAWRDITVDATTTASDPSTMTTTDPPDPTVPIPTEPGDSSTSSATGTTGPVATAPGRCACHQSGSAPSDLLALLVLVAGPRRRRPDRPVPKDMSPTAPTDVGRTARPVPADRRRPSHPE